jgi:LmbE family N-acetylglucosaminyl deacetylase
VLTTGAVTGSIAGHERLGHRRAGESVHCRQLTGTAGAIGTYQLNYQGPAVASFTGTFSQGNLVKISRTY